MSPRRRLILIPAVAVASAVALASAVTYISVRHALVASLDERLRMLTDNVATAPGPPTRTSAPAQRLDRPLGRSFLLVLPASPLGERAGYAQVVWSDGTIQRPLRAPDVRLAAGPRVVAVARGAAPFFYDSRLGGTPVRVYVTRFGPRGALQAAISLEAIDGTTGRLAWVLVMVGIAGVGLAAIVGRTLGGTMMRPIRHLARDVRYVAATQDLSLRVPALGGDELEVLGRSFNAMLEALADARRAQRQLVADASHELRTPLATVRASVELLALDVELAPAERRQLRADLVAQIQELTDLIGDLAELAREQAPESELERFDMARLVADVAERTGDRAPALRMELELDSCLVHADRARLRRAVANLLDNAVKWSPPGGTIRVALSEGELVVGDDGPGIDAADRARVFDRFYRTAEARRLPGSGLGLAIVRQVAEMHGGAAWVAPDARRGAEVHLRIPVLDGAAATTARPGHPSRPEHGGHSRAPTASARTALLTDPDQRS